MSFQSFSSLQQVIDKDLKDIELFDGRLFNYVKIVQHALTYAENDVKEKIISNRLSRSARWQIFWYNLRALLKLRKTKIPKLRKVVVMENGRYATDPAGGIQSAFLYHIHPAIASLSPSNLIWNESVLESEREYIRLDILRAQIGTPKPDEKARDLIRDVKEVRDRIKQSGRFGQRKMLQIDSAFHIFIAEFLFFNKLFAQQGIKVCLFDNHYHREGLLAALSLHGCKSFEIQHGLIARHDLYYVYPKYMKAVRHRSLFPDKLLLLGEYWRRILLEGYEHDEQSLSVIGEVRYTEDPGDPLFPLRTILITTQKNMAEFYEPLIRNWSEMLDEFYPTWQIVVKLHPAEKAHQMPLYEGLANKQNVTMGSNELNLFHLFRSSTIHISIYSTTLWDAIGFQICNFSVQNYSPSADYAADVIKDKVAFPIDRNDDPVMKYNEYKDSAQQLNRKDLYADFDPDSFCEFIKSAIQE